MYERKGNFGKALIDIDKLVEALPGVDQLRQRRGVTRFFHGDMKGAIAEVLLVAWLISGAGQGVFGIISNNLLAENSNEDERPQGVFR